MDEGRAPRSSFGEGNLAWLSAWGLLGSVENSSVVKKYYTTVGTRFNMQSNRFPLHIICASKIISDGFNLYPEFLRNLMD